MRFLLFLFACLLAAGPAAAQNLITTINIPAVRCRAVSCDAVGRVALGGASGVTVPAGTLVVRWDGAAFATANAVVTPSQVDVSSASAMYDVPVGEVLGVAGFGAVAASVVTNIGRYTTGSGAGAVVSSAVSASFYDDGSRTPSSVSLSPDASYPPDFQMALRQYHLTKSLFLGAQAADYNLSTDALIAVVNKSLTAPRAGTSFGTLNAITAFDFLDRGRTTYPAPNYTELRIAGPHNLSQAQAECGTPAQSGSHCESRAAYVRPENIDDMREACGVSGSSYLQDDCPWLMAHEFVRMYGVHSGVANKCLADFALPQRTFNGYVGDPFACTFVYGGAELPPEAELDIFGIVYADLQ